MIGRTAAFLKGLLQSRFSREARAGRVRVAVAAKTAVDAPPLSALVFLAAGMGGFLLMLRTLEGAFFQPVPVFCIAGGLCGLLWLGRRRGRRAFYALWTALLLVCALCAFAERELLAEQFSAIAASLAGTAAEEGADVTEAAAVLTAAGGGALAWLELAAGSHGLPLLAAEGLLLLGPLVGFWPAAGAAALLVLFQAGAWALSAAGKRGGRRLAGQCGAGMAAVLLTAALIAVPVSLGNLDRLYGTVYDLEGRVNRARREASGAAYAALADGRIPRGNNYHTGARHLILETDREPTETLYLRGFAGCEYLGGDWSDAGEADREFFYLASNVLEMRDSSGWIEGLFNRLYYLMNEQTESGDIPPPRQLTIWHGNGEYEDRYVPYFSAWGNGRRSGYALKYYQRDELHIDPDRFARDFRNLGEQCLRIEELYGFFSSDCFLRSPPGRQTPRLEELCEANPQEGLEDITAFILYTLHSNTTYTLTPGLAPLNEDVVENFLFERGRGYCVHYAAAATLMYRCYGVTARYAAGYAVPPEAFERQEDGHYTAAVADSSAHAWVEIFLPGCGWTPVEVTPAQSGMGAASLPGVSAGELEALQQRRGWDAAVPSLPERRADAARPARREEAVLPRLEVEVPPALVHALAGCAVYTLVLLPVLLDWRRLRRLRALDRGGPRRVFSRLLEMLGHYGLLSGCEGTEADFPQRLAEALPGLGEADARRLAEAAARAAYGETPPGDEEKAFAAGYYHRAAKEVCAQLPWYRRLGFRFWYGFG